MRTVCAKSSKREVGFTFEKKGKEATSSVDDEESDATEAKLVRKLKKGSGKYKGKLPFKCFDCGKIGHFVARCPYKKKEGNNEESIKDKDKKFYKSRRRNFQKKKILYTIDSDVSDDESESAEDCSEDEKQTNLFMSQEIQNEDKISRCDSGVQSNNLFDSDNEDEVDVEVDLEGELVCALEGIDKVRKEYKKYKKSTIKEQDQLSKSIEESNLNIIALTSQLEDAKKLCEVIKSELKAKDAKNWQKKHIILGKILRGAGKISKSG
ncbi:uncharacterized protein LOC131050850 [Cryptomeria japonica]|uniref:uncharacterized protein LOC131050850 n=1 Tax=Cryptomeria japonica TaxID=3369 RepID=UPI0025AD3DBF|nr:uncharacterized protein LOC131050850 [Cryptomeria japonica]